MNRYQITLTFITENEFELSQIPELLLEQWEQTGASMEGDRIEVTNVSRLSNL